MDEEYDYCDYEEEDESDQDFEIDRDSLTDDDDLESHQSLQKQSQDTSDKQSYRFKVLNTEEITAHMLDIIKEVSQIVELPPTIIRILLNHFNWDKDRLYERYYEGSEDNQQKLFEEARIVNPHKSKKVKSKSPRRKMIECKICFVDYLPKEMVANACGHEFCRECWIQYLTTKIMEEGQGPTISCGDSDCAILVDDETVFSLISSSNNPKVLSRYRQLITSNFVQSNKRFRWCPSPECGYVIQVEYVEFKAVKCVCNTTFCFKCGLDWHYPLECDIFRKWQKKCSDDSETLNWMNANTKDCPKCKTAIEKNGGCNRMHCRNRACDYQFCWLCMSDWNVHGYNPCNRYNESDEKQNKSVQDTARASLKRYLHYANRYTNHSKSLKFENKLYKKAHVQMEKMQRLTNMSWVEVQFLTNAVDVLTSCRHLLMYTYAFAFYLEKTNQVHIFEGNQNDLEAATEKLSEYLERDLEQDEAMVAADSENNETTSTSKDDNIIQSLIDIKQKVQDMYRYCESRRKVLLDHLKEGFDTDIWKMKVDLLA